MSERKTILNLMIFMAGAFACALSAIYLSGYMRWISSVAAAIVALYFLFDALKKDSKDNQSHAIQEPKLPEGCITELALLNEEGIIIASWEMYGKTSLVIGRDVGENMVNVNLNGATFASMIEREHAVLNYSSGQWYVEDLGSKNGISVVKPDGKKYQLAPDKPCMVGLGDILNIAMTKLLLR